MKANNAVLIITDFKDRPRPKANGNIISYCQSNKIEYAIAGAYYQYLQSQGIYPDEEDFIVERIVASLRRYKKKAKNSANKRNFTE